MHVHGCACMRVQLVFVEPPQRYGNYFPHLLLAHSVHSYGFGAEMRSSAGTLTNTIE